MNSYIREGENLLDEFQGLRFFLLHGTPNDSKVEIAFLYLEREAL